MSKSNVFFDALGVMPLQVIVERIARHFSVDFDIAREIEDRSIVVHFSLPDKVSTVKWSEAALLMKKADEVEFELAEAAEKLHGRTSKSSS